MWLIVVYVPLAHWVFSPEGWLAQRGVLDFAGGTVVEINSGFSALALALVLGKRRGWPGASTCHPTRFRWRFSVRAFSGSAGSGSTPVPHSAPMPSQSMRWSTPNSLPPLDSLGGSRFERVKEGLPTTLGAASGAVAGMVAITPCAGYVSAYARCPLVIGVVAGVLCVMR